MPDPDLQQNATILTLYKTLRDQQNALMDEIQNTTDPDVADTLSTEISELLHRIVLTQNLLFQADSAALRKSVKSVQTASVKLQSALNSANKAADIVNAMSAFLTCVDGAIDIAKKIAA